MNILPAPVLAVTVPSLEPIEYVVIIAYLIFLASVGPIMRKFNRNSDDYFRGGARTKWWLIGPSLSMSIMSATIFTGVSGAVFEAGLAPMASNLGQFAAGGLLILFLAAWYRQLRKVTPAEVVRERFGPTTEQFFSYLNMCMQPIYGSFQLLGLAIFAATVFQIPLTWMVILMGCVVGIYSVTGGKWAVMANDFLQNLVLQAVVISVAILAVIKIGGIGNFFSRVGESGGFDFVHAAGDYPDGRYTIGWIIAVFCMQFVGQLQLGWSARFFAAKDGKEAQKATALMFVLIFISMAFIIVIPLVARVLFYDQVMSYAGTLNKPSEAAFVVGCLNLVPTGLMGMVLVAMFAATSSSMDTGLNANAAVVVRNIMPPLRRALKMPPLDAHTELKWGRIVTVILALTIIGITFTLAKVGRSGIFELMLNFASAINLPISLPFFLVLFFRKAPRISAIASIVSGLLAPWLITPLLAARGIELDFPQRVALIAICSLAGFFGSYLFRFKESPEEQEQTKRFYADMHRPVDFSKEVGEGNDLAQLTLMGRLTLVVGGLMLVLLFIPNSPKDRLVILCMGGAITTLGGLLMYAARRKKLEMRCHK